MTKIIKILKNNNIKYELKTDRHGIRNINFIYNGKLVGVGEFVGNGGNTVEGIMISKLEPNSWGTHTFGSQKSVVEYLERIFERQGVFNNG